MKSFADYVNESSEIPKSILFKRTKDTLLNHGYHKDDMYVDGNYEYHYYAKTKNVDNNAPDLNDIKAAKHCSSHEDLKKLGYERDVEESNFSHHLFRHPSDGIKVNHDAIYQRSDNVVEHLMAIVKEI